MQKSSAQNLQSDICHLFYKLNLHFSIFLASSDQDLQSLDNWNSTENDYYYSGTRRVKRQFGSPFQQFQFPAGWPFIQQQPGGGGGGAGGFPGFPGFPSQFPGAAGFPSQFPGAAGFPSQFPAVSKIFCQNSVF